MIDYYSYSNEDFVSDAELELFTLITDYRASLGLSYVPLSQSLSVVAARHAVDTVHNIGSYAGHSFSDAPYDANNSSTYKNMWEAPQRLDTAYPGFGFEIATGYPGAYTATLIMTAEVALSGWKSSQPHDEVITNEGPWADVVWNAMGVAIYEGTSFVWFGREADPAESPLNGLEYIASHNDLVSALGANHNAGLAHYEQHGFREGRAFTFDSLEYIASHEDLIDAFGAAAYAGAEHYITWGGREGRSTTFNSLEYIASYSDLVAAFGTNADAGAVHFIQNGANEGRQVSFDGLEYIASHSDLFYLGANSHYGTTHYIQNGFKDGRVITFDSLEYIASYADLIANFGTNSEAGAVHYINYGRAEGRQADHFNAERYLSNYEDLQEAFGSDLDAATLHYIESGFSENRTDDFIFV